MKSKKWLISMGLAVVLVVAFALPACEPAAKSGWYTPGGEKISFEIGTDDSYFQETNMVVEDLQDFGLDVKVKSFDPGTYYDFLYDPPGGKLQAAIFAEDPSPDPWSDWIWAMVADPLDAGLEWNPCWYNSTRLNYLNDANFLAADTPAKKLILYELQQILADDVPLVFLVREEMVSAYRSDRWDNWYNEIGGPASWINEWSIRGVTNLTADTQLDIGVGLLPGNLNMDQDPMMYSNAGCLYLMLVYENLWGFPRLEDPGVTAYTKTPKLAINYSVEDVGENQVWTVDLREGVKWHDYDTFGKNFTADDVVYTCKNVTYMWSANRPVNWTAVEAHGDEILPEDVLVERVNDYKVTFTYIDGYHQNVGYFPIDFMWYAMVPKHVFGSAGETNYPDNWNEDPAMWDGEYIGTGPYKVETFAADDYILLERFDQYWGKDDPVWGATAEKVRFQLYSVEGNFWMAFQSPTEDCMEGSAAYSVPPGLIETLNTTAGVTLEVVPDMSVHLLVFNLHPTAGYAPLLELPLRQAIAAAIDKEDIIAMVFGGHGEAADSFIYLESPMHKPGLPNMTYDPTEAAKILTDAGYKLYEDDVQVN